MMCSAKKMLKDEKNEDLEETALETADDVAESQECEDSEVAADEILAENKKLRDDYLRAYAEAENVKKRCHAELEKNTKFAVADFAKNLLPVADNLQRAIEAAQKDENAEECAGLRKGIELTQSELIKVFDKFGIHKMEVMGKIFDPNFHQVVQEVADENQKPGTVVAEIQSGYMIHDRILREAVVVVAK